MRILSGDRKVKLKAIFLALVPLAVLALLAAAGGVVRVSGPW
jgi:hypothetical protein